MIDSLSPLTVIGVGLVGGSLCQAFRKKGLKVWGVSSKPTIDKALSLNAIDEGYEYHRMEEPLSKSRAVFVCTPLREIERMLPEVLGHVQRGAVVSDVGSTKRVICETAGGLLAPKRHSSRLPARRVHFVGGHPMAGSEKTGVEHSNPYLFYDAVYVLTPLQSTPRTVVRALSSLIGLLGAKVMILTPELHDRIASDVSHLPHLLAVLLANQLAQRNSDIFRNLAAGGFRDMTRIASSSYSVWRDVIGTNRTEVSRSLDDFRSNLAELIENLADEDYLGRLFEGANRERTRIPKYSKGFLTPLFDVRVTVKDRPGELAKITNVAYYRGVNIKDIEIVNIREGEGGILRLGFTGKDDAHRVASVLEELGYEVSVQD